MKDYEKLIENIQKRINPDNVRLTKAFSSELSAITYSSVLKYVRYAMKGVESEYTAKSRLAGERVKGHLKDQLSDISFQYQGSVMTETHIKGASDIDLLVISEKFYRFDRSTVVSALSDNKKYYNFLQLDKLQWEIKNAGYTGNTLNDLRDNRIDSENILKKIYDECDIKPPKAIKIKNKSLNRDVDVVIANWYDNVSSIINDKAIDYRGIQVYNKDLHQKGSPGYPFLSIQRINLKSKETTGRLKKMIRFLKNIKADSAFDITLSSFQFNAICYAIPMDQYQDKSFYQLVPILYIQLDDLYQNRSQANNLMSVDGNEYIFRNNPNQINELKYLMVEIKPILEDLDNEKVL